MWGGQSWLPPGFYPACSGALHMLKSRLKRRLQAGLPAPPGAPTMCNLRVKLPTRSRPADSPVF